MSKSLQWTIGILSVLFLGAAIVFFIMWNKKRKEAEKAKSAPAEKPQPTPSELAAAATATEVAQTAQAETVSARYRVS